MAVICRGDTVKKILVSICAIALMFCSPSSNAQDASSSSSTKSNASPKGKVKIASSTPRPAQTAAEKKKAAEEKKKRARLNAAAIAKKKRLAQMPFINNHYVLTGHLPVNGYHKGKPVVVIVDKGSHFTHALQLQGKKIVRVLTISNAVGNKETPSPPGPYTVVGKKKLPWWVPPKSIDPKQKPVHPYNQTRKNPLGVAAIYLNKFEINLHGTNQQNLIRKSVSHGCIRHSNKDIMKLYNIVNKGDRVYIVNKFRGKVLNRSDFVRS